VVVQARANALLTSAGLVVVCLLASGCVQTVRRIGDSQTMGPQSVFDDAAIQQVEEVCRDLRARRAGSERNAARRGRSTACDMLTSFIAARQAISSNVPGASSAAALSYFSHGANVSDIFCAAWFAQLDGARRTSRQAHDTVTGIGALTTAVQAFTGAEPPVIGLTSSIFTETGLYFDRAEQNYLLSPDLDTVHNSLFAYRQRFFEQIRRDNLVSDSASAMRYLRQYEATCAALNVQYFIDVSIARSGSGETLEVPQATSPAARADIEALKLYVVSELEGDLVLSDVGLVQVAAWLSLPAETGAADAVLARRARVEADLERIRISAYTGRDTLAALKAASADNIARLRDRLASGPGAETIADRVRAYLAEGDLRASAAVADATRVEIEALRADIGSAVGAATPPNLDALTWLTAYWVHSAAEQTPAVVARRQRIRRQLETVSVGSSANLFSAFNGLPENRKTEILGRLRSGRAAAEFDALALAYISRLDQAIADETPAEPMPAAPPAPPQQPPQEPSEQE
jgi:hypothetical protein